MFLSNSAFAVTISDVGFGRYNRRRHSIVAPQTTNGKSWPTRLEPREAVTLHTAPGIELDPAIVRDAVAYAATDCEEVRHGGSPMFTQYVYNLTRRRAAA